MPVHGPCPYLEPQEDETYRAPGCTVIVSYDMHSRDYPAIIDSGAEYTSIPIELVDAFSLEQCGEIEVSGTTGQPEVQGIYEINVEFLGLAFPLQPCIGGTGPITTEFVLIGRDILNDYRVILDGPKLIFTIE